jgi:hypothetical protein
VSEPPKPITELADERERRWVRREGPLDDPGLSSALLVWAALIPLSLGLALRVEVLIAVGVYLAYPIGAIELLAAGCGIHKLVGRDRSPKDREYGVATLVIALLLVPTMLLVCAYLGGWWHP